jgi:pimeloyl-ACP methyl ester carboxylesterase
MQRRELTRRLAIASLMASILVIVWAGHQLSAPGPLQVAEKSVEWDLQQTDCWFGERWFRRATCAWFVPGAIASGEDVMLPVARLQRNLWSPSQRVTIVLNGGPGGSTRFGVDSMRMWREWIDWLGLDHDLVLYDQRGTGLAQPQLNCPGLIEQYRSLLDSGLDVDAQWASVEPLLKRCAEDVPLADRAVGTYSTRASAEDLRRLIEAVRLQWGYRDVAVYGVSYGTRLAVEALAEGQPDVSRVVLDSYYPAGTDPYLAFPDSFAGILAGMEAHCRRQANCPIPEDGLRALLSSVLEQVEREPQWIVAENDRNGATLNVLVDAPVLFTLVEHMLYASFGARELTLRLLEIRDGRPGADWQEIVSNWIEGLSDPGFSDLAHVLYECRDNPQGTAQDEMAVLARHSDWTNALRRARDSFSFCDRTGVPAQPLQEKSIDLPTLLLAAEFDPRTPAALALAAVRGFGDLRVIKLPISGHSVVDVHHCAARAAGAFLNNGSLTVPRICRRNLGDIVHRTRRSR